MNLQIDMTVLGCDDHSLGTVDKVIFERDRTDAFAIVVSSGAFRRTRRVLPISQVLGIGRLTVKTDLSGPQFSCLPRFDEREFRRPPATWMAANGWAPGHVRWPADGFYPVASAPSAPPEEVLRSVPPLSDTIPHPAHTSNCACHLLEEQREETRPHRFEVDPYDVLNGPVIACCRTPYEWGDASMINPLPRPEEGGLSAPANDVAIGIEVPMISRPAENGSEEEDLPVGGTR